VTRRFRVARAAAEELTDAVRWYEKCRRGLGGEFFDLINDTLNLVESHPEVGAPAVGNPNIRRLVVPRFPYQVVYRLDPHEIVILAFAHSRRRPGFWKRRR
jgi:plasmid stabilization system protein ParE